MSGRRFTAATGGTRRPPSTGARLLAALALAATFAATPAVPAGASERWFTVEIIVFDDLRDENLHAEHWPAEPGEPSLQGAIELVRSHEGEEAEAVHAFRLLDRSELSLGGVRDSLRRSAHYRPFLHEGWRLPGLPHRAARAARIGPHLGDDGAGIPEPVGGERPDERPMVRGTVKVSLARYLQVDVDLLYRRPRDGEAAAPDHVPARFRLISKRRMRSEELHYIEHPLFGVLVSITPFRIPPRSAPEA